MRFFKTVSRLSAFIDTLPVGAGVLLAALLGAVVGSFIATLVLRWPAGRSILGRSRCDGCAHALGPRDLVPLLSALAARGRCRHCSAPIDPFHARVEMGAALLGGAALALMPGTAGWLWALFGWLLLPLALLDARHLWLPDRLTLPLAVVGLLLAGPLMETRLLDRWIAAVTGGLALALLAWAWRRRAREGMGGGDPKLVAAIGAWIGWQALPLMLLLASLSGIVWALAAQGKGDTPLSARRVPFGLFACGAAWAAVPLWPLLAR
ncbi:MAG: prepilin peptidase [Alphaproteobacteria bacterium HGW-Alphaproteobacteria-13]|jgi:leader peptidase (prepilin peptidase)/N-methyltransferase|nr:MAG: prepilin peptidase [Alphaproteobacteria bacterium HGW-Alphaproteobacteria-13]